MDLNDHTDVGSQSIDQCRRGNSRAPSTRTATAG